MVSLPPLLAPGSSLTRTLPVPQSSVFLPASVLLLTLPRLPGPVFLLLYPRSLGHLIHTYGQITPTCSSCEPRYVHSKACFALSSGFSEGTAMSKTGLSSLVPEIILPPPRVVPTSGNGTTDLPVAGAPKLGSSVDPSPSLTHSMTKARKLCPLTSLGRAHPYLSGITAARSPPSSQREPLKR